MPEEVQQQIMVIVAKEAKEAVVTQTCLEPLILAVAEADRVVPIQVQEVAVASS